VLNSCGRSEYQKFVMYGNVCLCILYTELIIDTGVLFCHVYLVKYSIFGTSGLSKCYVFTSAYGLNSIYCTHKCIIDEV
jgi:hypothetical protein